MGDVLTFHKLGTFAGDDICVVQFGAVHIAHIRALLDSTNLYIEDFHVGSHEYVNYKNNSCC